MNRRLRRTRNSTASVCAICSSRLATASFCLELATISSLLLLSDKRVSSRDGGSFLCYSYFVKKLIAILSLAECPDCFAAAYSAWKKFGDSAIYIPVYHQMPPPEEIYGKEVYLVDYSYKLEVVKEILPRVKSLMIIDHHVTNQEQIKLVGGVYDVNHSGGVLSWMYFHPDTPVPQLFKHIEDIDIWAFKLKNTAEIAEMITIYDFDFNIWDKIITGCETEEGIKKYVHEGEILLRKLNQSVKKIVNNAEVINFEGYPCLLANSILYTSQVGNELSKKMPPIGLVWSRRNNKVVVSIRSDGTVDVAKLAEKYGGGGHKSAAGFSWEEKGFLRLKRK